jgi:hypothetical protein
MAAVDRQRPQQGGVGAVGVAEGAAHGVARAGSGQSVKPALAGKAKGCLQVGVAAGGAADLIAAQFRSARLVKSQPDVFGLAPVGQTDVQHHQLERFPGHLRLRLVEDRQ